jgi:long-chain acyl-CoA synthetase
MNHHETLVPAMRRVHETFVSHCASCPDQAALVDDSRTLTYGELGDAVRALEHCLRDAGVRAGDRVLFVAENCVAAAACMLALSKLDAWAVTVNARLSPREIDDFLAHCGARRALYFNTVSNEARAHAEQHGAQRVDWPYVGELMLGPLNAETVPEPVAQDAGQVSTLVYTTGTTGAPKAVMLTHANLLFAAANGRRMGRILTGDILYAVVPMAHIYGGTLIIGALLNGATIHLVPRFNPESVAKALANEGITVMNGAPAMYAKLLEWSERGGTPLRAPSLRIAQVGSAPLTLQLKEAFERTFGVTLQNGYGMTEASPTISQTRVDAPRSDCSVGHAISGVEIRLHESNEAGVGELWARGPGVMKGYYRAPEATAETITPDGWLRTGDLARVDLDGAIWIVGRAKDLIIRSGFNVYPIEVEQVLNAFPGVLQSAVVGRAVEGNEEVVAYVERAPGSTPDLDALRAYLGANLSPYKVPSEIVVLDQMPAAATGKILKKELQLRAAAKTKG